MPDSPKNIIVRMPNWIGDLVMATPILADLRAQFKRARITAMCLASHSPLLEHDPHVDEIFRFTQPNRWIHRLHHGEVIETLQIGKYDMGVLLTNSFSSAWWFWRGKVRNRIGFADHGRSLLLNQAVAYPKDKQTLHQVIVYKKLLEPLGIPVSDTAPCIHLSRDAMGAARHFLRQLGVHEDHVVVGINPGAAYGSAKCWLPDRFRAVAERMLQDPNRWVLFFGDHAGAPLVNEICKGLPPRVINLAGETNLLELSAFIKNCDVLLTNDSGPMHIAAAVGTPPVALFGSTNDTRTGPYGIGRVIHKHVDCSPCYKRVCPVDFRCMKRIEVDEVCRAIDEILKERQK